MHEVINIHLSLDEFKAIIKEAVKSEVEPKRYLTRKDAAKHLNISLPTLHDWTKKGLIRCVKIGGRVFYTELELNIVVTNKEHKP